MDSLRGQLLIAGGALFDPNFRQTVVLVGEHNADGALGVVLNRTSTLTVAEAFPALGEVAAPDELLFVGGPVQPSAPVLLAELTHPDFADLLVFDSIGFLVGDVKPEARQAIHRARVFAGYAGWGSGQLEAEMEQGSWILAPARVEDVFTTDPASLWRTVLELKGGKYRRLSTMPFDPSMN
jgi:putative transcriptional regulator